MNNQELTSTLDSATSPTQRRWPRQVVRWVAQWVDSCGGMQSAQIRDVSEKGVFLRPLALTPDIFVGTQMLISFAIPRHRSGMTTIRGTVRWKGSSYSHQCSGLGIEFDDINPRVQSYLNGTMAQV